jgi:hypothetical protein
MYFPRLMPVYVGLIMLSAYFVFFPQVEYNCALICKSVLACCLYYIALRVVGAILVVFLRRWHKICTASGKQGPIPEEMSKTQLSKRKQGNLD